MTKRCPYCGEPQHNTLQGVAQYKCGTLRGSIDTQSGFCLWLMDPGQNAKVKRPAMKKHLATDGGCQAKFSVDRERAWTMQVGTTIFVKQNYTKFRKAMYYRRNRADGHRYLYRSANRDHCEVSLVGNLDGIEVGESRLYSDSLRHTLTRVVAVNQQRISTGEGVVFGMDLIDNIYWIRRLL
jgi:hypothetical protein